MCVRLWFFVLFAPGCLACPDHPLLAKLEFQHPLVRHKYRNTGRGGRFGRAAFGGGAYRGKFQEVKTACAYRKEYWDQHNQIVAEEAVTSQPFREDDMITQVLTDMDPSSTLKAFMTKT